jgi:hypothetical protein
MKVAKRVELNSTEPELKVSIKDRLGKEKVNTIMRWAYVHNLPKTTRKLRK